MKLTFMENSSLQHTMPGTVCQAVQVLYLIRCRFYHIHVWFNQSLILHPHFANSSVFQIINTEALGVMFKTPNISHYVHYPLLPKE